MAGAASYSVYQSTTLGAYGSALGSVAPPVSNYDLTGLTNNVAYYFKVSAMDSYGNTADSNEVSATPYRRSESSGDDGDSNPTVRTGAATSVTQTMATIQGKIESDGNAAVTEYGFMYGKDKSSLTGKERAGSGSHRGNFTCGLSGLEAGATYYYRAYARTDGGILYGGVLSFTTEKEKQMFPDVQPGDWFCESVLFVYDKGLMNGTGSGLFSPNGAMTRGMVVTVLHRMGGDTGSYMNPFGDVASGEYYENAIAWAYAKGIVSGTGADSFSPDAAVTREQFAVMLWNYAKYRGYDVSIGEDTNILSYGDAFGISNYAYSALQWACGAGILEGDTDGNLSPRASATRVQVAAMLQRFIENVAG